MNFIDLFCGGGFGARGAVNGGGIPTIAVDIWPIATKNYAYNFPEADVITKSVDEVNVKALSKQYTCDVLLTSPECTSHSIARGARPISRKSQETANLIMPWITISIQDGFFLKM